RGDVPAAINFWQYNSRLPEGEFVELVRVEDMLPALGLSPQTPLLGWVFSERWAASHSAAIKGFLAAAQAARDLLASSPEEWQKIAPLAQVADPGVLARLREAYRRGSRKASRPPMLPTRRSACSGSWSSSAASTRR